MFEKIVIRRHADGQNPIDAGLLAETLLFYEHVHILFDRSNLNSILKTIGADNLILLLDEKRISGTFLSDNLGAITTTQNNIQFHNYMAFQIAADKDGTKISTKDWVTRGFVDALGDERSARKKAKQFIDRISFRAHNSAPPNSSGNILDAARKDLDDREYVQAAVEIILRNAVPGFALPRNWFCYVVKRQLDFLLCTNLDFTSINKEYHKWILPTQNSITSSWLLANLLDARADMFFAADYMAEFATDKIRSDLIKIRFQDLLKRRFANDQQLEAFQDLIFGNARAIRETVNSGEKSFDEFLNVLEKASRFKRWLSEGNPDAQLIGEFYKAATAETWADNLPTKFIRFVICTFASLIPVAGPVAGPVVGLGDAIFADRLIKGWKPNQFVEGPLRRFIDK